MQSEDRRRLLGEFVRAHRERLPPDSPAGRRRTPGLRREELAARAGIGATWCAWIEQGRQVDASPATLGRIAAALELTPAERAYLFDLAGRRDPSSRMPETPAQAPASLHAMVEALSHPAYGLDRLWNACCWNRAAGLLFEGWLGEHCQKNLLRFVFVEPAARELIPDWEERATRLLAEFRTDYGRAFNDSRTHALVEQLRHDSAVFERAWQAQAVIDRKGGARAFNHPGEGLVTYRQHTFSPADRPDYKLVMLEPTS